MYRRVAAEPVEVGVARDHVVALPDQGIVAELPRLARGRRIADDRQVSVRVTDARRIRPVAGALQATAASDRDQADRRHPHCKSALPAYHANHPSRRPAAAIPRSKDANSLFVRDL